MECKRRSGKKRIREVDYREKSVADGKIFSGTKRRKCNKHDLKIRKSSKNVTNKIIENAGSEVPKKGTAFKSPFNSTAYDASTDSTTARVTGKPVHCLASCVKKTYSSSCRRHMKKDKSKLRTNSRLKLQVEDGVTENSNDFVDLCESTRESSDDRGKTFPTSYAKTGRDEKAITKMVINDGYADHYNLPSMSMDSGTDNVIVVKDGSCDKWKESFGCNANKEVNPDCSQTARLPHNGVTSLVFSGMPSQPRIITSAVACPVAPILCHNSAPGIPLLPMQSLNVNTSAISSVSTPVVALPMIPEVPLDVSGTIGQSNNSSSALQSVLKADPCIDHQAMQDASLDHSMSGTTTQNQLLVGDVISENPQMYSSGNMDAESPEVQEDRIPVISIENDNHSLLIEKGSIPDVEETISNKSTSAKGDVSYPLTGHSTEKSSNSVTSLKVDNWSSYLLQRLELLFDREEDCDLILRFSSGEILKAHRTIISACTSLLMQPRQPKEMHSEVAVPPDLDFTSVEHVLRFVYSGRLDVRGSKSQLSAIYIASQKLQVSLLTRLLDRRFPHLTPNKLDARKMCKRTEKSLKHLKLRHGKGSPKKLSGTLSDSGIPSKRQKLRNDGNSDVETKESHDLNSSSTDESQGTSKTDDDGSREEEEEGGHDGSLYFLVTNSQKIAQANAAVRRKRPAETARPTRFELEDEMDSNSVQIATWSSKSSVPPYFSAVSGEVQENGFAVNTPGSDSTICVNSPNGSVLKNTNVTWSNSSVSSAQQINLEGDNNNSSSNNSNSALSVSQDPFSLLTQDVCNKNASTSVEQNLSNKFCDASSSNSNTQDLTSKDRENPDEDDAGNESEELMEKISNICKQLEDGDSEDNESSCEEINDCNSPQGNSNTCRTSFGVSQSRSSLSKNEESSSESNDCIVLNSPITPTRSILKKKKEKATSTRLKKRVSFPLDENDELINEVATYSNCKEPSQSLIDVQKTVGSFRSSEDSASPVKLTLSLKKKVLMNLSLDDTDLSESHSSHDYHKGRNKKVSASSGQSTSQGVNQGDMSNHAKIISEVLKKYPHLVKDRKNIRLKILKKGNDKTNSGKLVKSKVQYLVLSENEHKTKSSGKHDKNTGVGSKTDAKLSARVTQNSTQKFACPECKDITFPTYFNLKKHVTSEHKDKSSSILASIENVPYACYSCFLDEPLEFADYCSYQQHMKEVHSKREARLCSMCGYRPARKLELTYHQYIEHNKLPRNITFPKCDLCDHVAMNDAALLKHRSQHANADNYTCSVCGVAFRSFGALQGHMQTKLCQSKPSVSHNCPYCPQTFARSYNLKAHCKSVHRAAHMAAQVACSSMNESKQAELSTKPVTSSKKLKDTTDVSDSGEIIVEHVCETLSSVNSNQSSSEAEALSTVANSLAASLGLPEETVNHYMYTQGNKLDFSGDLSEEKYDDTASRTNEVHLLESAVSVSGYPGNVSVGPDGTYTTSQSPLSTTTTVGTFYPVGVVPGQIVPGQILSSDILQNSVLPGTCVNVAGSTVLGAPSHSWTYVAYQVPTSSEDLSSIIGDTSSISTISTDQSTSSVEIPMDAKSKNESAISGSNRVGSRDPQNPLVVMTNTAAQVNISHASHMSTTQNYDAFSSQFV